MKPWTLSYAARFAGAQLYSLPQKVYVYPQTLLALVSRSVTQNIPSAELDACGYEEEAKERMEFILAGMTIAAAGISLVQSLSIGKSNKKRKTSSKSKRKSNNTRS